LSNSVLLAIGAVQVRKILPSELAVAVKFVRALKYGVASLSDAVVSEVSSHNSVALASASAASSNTLLGPDSTTVVSDEGTVVSDDGTVVSVVSAVSGDVVVGGTVVSSVINRVDGLRYPPVAPVVSEAVAASSSA
jgi:hypothetical protein